VPGRLLIVEDHELLAESLALSLRAQGHDVVVTPAARGYDSILDDAVEAKPEVVLLDLHLGDDVGTSLPLIPRLGRAGARVVMVTGVTDEIELAMCIEAGAVGVVSKAVPFETLVEDVDRILRGQQIMSEAEREQLLLALREARAAERERMEPFETLTPREQTVLALLIDGHQADRIAEECFVSLATVRSQIRSILQKLGVNSQLAAVAMARRAGWQPALEAG
jgi:two-component system nitrate/nitrite response regulator NarL